MLGGGRVGVAWESGGAQVREIFHRDEVAEVAKALST